jgi:hypothetical protein
MKQETNIDELLSQWTKVDKVDAPDYLLTRIKAKIENQVNDKLTPGFAISFGLSFILLIIFQVSAIKQTKETNSSASVQNEFYQSNDIYND